MLRRCLLSATALLIMVAAAAQFTLPVKADKYDDRIRAIQREIDAYQSEAKKFRDQANTLQAQLNSLSNEKAQIQAQVNLSQTKFDKLQVDIADTQEKIDDNKGALGEIIADLYVDDQISPLEMLASSKNIGDYVDRQEYRSSVSDQLTQTINKINVLKKELEQQKKDTERVLADQTNARNALAAKEAEQQRLVDETKGQESAYQQLAEASNQRKLEVQRQQQAAIEAAMRRGGSSFSPTTIGDPSKGGYPWEAGCYVDANAWSSGTDPLGYGCRQCVSYTAFKVGQRTGNYPRYWGNANQWPASARASGYQTGSTPRANSVGVIMSGQYGHTVWVEAVNSDGSLIVSQYNYYNAGGPGWGNYSKMRVSAATYDVFIYF